MQRCSSAIGTRSTWNSRFPVSPQCVLLMFPCSSYYPDGDNRCQDDIWAFGVCLHLIYVSISSQYFTEAALIVLFWPDCVYQTFLWHDMNCSLLCSVPPGSFLAPSFSMYSHLPSSIRVIHCHTPCLFCLSVHVALYTSPIFPHYKLHIASIHCSMPLHFLFPSLPLTSHSPD